MRSTGGGLIAGCVSHGASRRAVLNWDSARLKTAVVSEKENWSRSPARLIAQHFFSSFSFFTTPRSKSRL